MKPKPKTHPKKHPEKKSKRTPVLADSATILREYNAWRRDSSGATRYPIHSAQRIGEAIDDAIKALEKLSTPAQ